MEAFGVGYTDAMNVPLEEAYRLIGYKKTKLDAQKYLAQESHNNG